MSLIGKSIGNYQVKEKIGEGGMGSVYLGEHPLIGKRVAVKVLLEELAAKEDIVSRFFNEAKAVNDIGHQNIVDIVDFGKMPNEVGGDIVYFIMEYLDGESLSSRLRSTGLAFNETMHVIAQCCSGLEASHAKGIVHRDLKPENIYLCPRGTDKNFVKILDFGIAKLTGDGGSQSHKTRTGLVIGTPTYMSPEQCEGKGLVDHRSDVYSLGVVMYELLTGRVPFPGDGFGEILVAHLTKQPEPPSTVNPDVTPELEAIVMHSIEKDRNLRFQSMAEFEAAVRDPAAHLAAYQGQPGHAGAAAGPMAMAPTGMGPAPVLGGSNRIPTTGQRGPTTGVDPRPTTLSGAASEVSELPVRKNRAPLYAAAAVVAAIAGGGYVMTQRKPPPVAAAPAPAVVPLPVAPPPEPVVPTPEQVSVTVTSTPPGASVLRLDDGEAEVGKTPVELKLDKGSAPFQIKVQLEGYVTRTRTVKSDKNLELAFALAKEPAARPVAQPSSSHRTRDRRRPSPRPTPGADSDMNLLRPNFD